MTTSQSNPPETDLPRRETAVIGWSTGVGFAGTWDYVLASGVVHCGEEIAEVLGLPAAPAECPLAEFLAHIDPRDREQTAAALAAAALEGGRFDRRFRLCSAG